MVSIHVGHHPTPKILTHTSNLPSLPDCGHTFCEGCLQDWFSKTDNESAVLLHSFDTNAVNGRVQQYNQPRFDMNFGATAFLEGAYNGMSFNVARPVERPLRSQAIPYTCPLCHAEVNSRPTEDFALKAIARFVAAASGETSPDFVGKTGISTAFDKFFSKYIVNASGSGSR
jgi:hypothetical protein